MFFNNSWFIERRGLITGSTGWFGKWVCRRLYSMGAAYIAPLHTDNQDITNFPIPNRKIDYIIHLAPGNVDRVIECAKKHDATVLFTSSGAVYQDSKGAYGMMKVMNENKLINSGVKVKIARCYAFAGSGIPLNSGFALGNFINSGLKGEEIRILGSGTSIRTYLYMSDLVGWLLKILKEGIVGKPYDVGGEEQVTILELAQMVKKHFNKSYIVVENRRFDKLPVYVPNLDNAYGLGCKIEVPLIQAINRTIDHYKEEHEKNMSNM